jgi:hypothetical protein
MKNINQIFKNNIHLMDEPEVIELIEYCQELEGEVLEKKIEDTYSKEEIYLQILKEIYDSCDKTLTDDQLSERFKETPRVDFKEAVINLKKYMGAVSQMYGFML